MRKAIMALCMLLGASLSDAAMAGSFPGSADHVRVVTVTRDSSDQNRITVTLQIDPGYHVNANPASDKNLIPTTLTFERSQPTQVVYPLPTRFQPKFADEPIDVYQGTVKIIAIFPEGTITPQIRLRGSVLVQACTDEICLPPAEIVVSE